MIVAGPWDFAGLLFALSGFLLLGGRTILADLHEQIERASLQRKLSGQEGNPRVETLREYLWYGIAGGYFCVVSGGSAWMLWRRRNLTLIYNAEPETFVQVLGDTLDRMDFIWTRLENQLILKPKFSPQIPVDQTHAIPLLPEHTGSRVDLDLSPGLRNVTLKWAEDDSYLRDRVETELGKLRTQFRARYNPAGFWLLCAASFLMILVFMSLAFYLVLVFGGP